MPGREPSAALRPCQLATRLAASRPHEKSFPPQNSGKLVGLRPGGRFGAAGPDDARQRVQPAAYSPGSCFGGAPNHLAYSAL